MTTKDELLEVLDEIVSHIYSQHPGVQRRKEAIYQIRSIIEQHYSLTKHERKVVLKYVNDNLRVNGGE